MASFDNKYLRQVSRYECKYLVPYGMLRVLREDLRPFVEPDAYAALNPGNRYVTNSLYLDSPGLRLYRMTAHGEKSRYKLRIRTYSDEKDMPVFFEIKKRADGIVKKIRCAARRSYAQRFLEGQNRQSNPRDSDPDIAEFLQLSREVDAGPTFRVRYDREAYESRGGEPTRITFDTNLSYCLTTTPELSVGGLGWRKAMTDQAIIEIKFTDRFPTWVQEFVERYELQRCSVPKYCLSVDKALDRGECLIPVPGHHSLAYAL